MILQALYELAEREGLARDLDFEAKPIRFVVRVGHGGRYLGVVDTRGEPELDVPGRKRKAMAKTFRVPREPARTSGARAFFLYDKAEYVIGRDPDGKRPADQLAARAALFRARVEECARATGDDAVRAMLELLTAVAAGEMEVVLPDDTASNDLFAFAFANEEGLITDRPAVVEHWRSLREALAEGQPTRCLVTGRLAVPAKLHTQVKYVPGASSSGVPLVGFNAAAFTSHGWSGNENAPVSQRAAETYATALQRLLHPAPPDPAQPGRVLPRLHLRLGGDTVVCFWSRRGDDQFASALGGLLEANREEVPELYHSVWRGRPPALVDPSQFYALTLSGSQGRVIVRGWFESTVEEVVANVARHFADLEMVRNTPPPKKRELPPHLPLRDLLGSLTPPGRSSSVPAPLAQAFFEAALQGTPYPLSALQRAIERQRAEIGRGEWTDLVRRDSRAAVIRAVINRLRRRRGEGEEIASDMDETNTSPGYLLGRLMAVIERLQTLALGDVNATVVDRFFSSASAAPRAVFVRLLKNARHHARKAMDDQKKKGFAISLERRMDALIDTFDPKDNGFPAHLDLEQQGLFVLGYHQQRHALFQRRPEAAGAAETDAPTEPNAEA